MKIFFCSFKTAVCFINFSDLCIINFIIFSISFVQALNLKWSCFVRDFSGNFCSKKEKKIICGQHFALTYSVNLKWNSYTPTLVAHHTLPLPKREPPLLPLVCCLLGLRWSDEVRHFRTLKPVSYAPWSKLHFTNKSSLTNRQVTINISLNLLISKIWAIILNII